MAYLELPLSGGGENPNFDSTFTLDGKDYNIKFRYNDRADFWSMSIYDSSDVAIREGIRVVSNFPLTRKIADPARATGLMFAFDPRSSASAPSIEELGTTVTLHYKDKVPS